MNNIQLKIDKMVSLLDKEGYRVSMHTYHSGQYGSLFIDYKNKEYNRFFYINIHEGSNNLCSFRVAVNINEDGLTLRESECLIKYWQSAIDLCRMLNKLNIPYLSDYECEDLVYKEYFESAYKKIGKRFVVTVSA